MTDCTHLNLWTFFGVCLIYCEESMKLQRGFIFTHWYVALKHHTSPQNAPRFSPWKYAWSRSSVIQNVSRAATSSQGWIRLHAFAALLEFYSLEHLPGVCLLQHLPWVKPPPNHQHFTCSLAVTIVTAAIETVSQELGVFLPSLTVIKRNELHSVGDRSTFGSLDRLRYIRCFFSTWMRAVAAASPCLPG